MENTPRRKKPAPRANIHSPPMVDQVRQIESIHFTSRVSLRWRTDWGKRNSKLLVCLGWMLLFLQVIPTMTVRLRGAYPRRSVPGLAEGRASPSMWGRQGDMLNKEALSGSICKSLQVERRQRRAQAGRARVHPMQRPALSSATYPSCWLTLGNSLLTSFLVSYSPVLFSWVWGDGKNWFGQFGICICNAD